MSSTPLTQKGGTKLSAVGAECADFNTCKCAARMFREGCGVQCIRRKPFEGGLLCKTHQKMLDARGSLTFGWFNKERPTHYLDGKPIPWLLPEQPYHGSFGNTRKTSDGATTIDGSKHIVFSRDGVNFHEDMKSGGVISITGETAHFRNEYARKLLERGIDVPDGCRVVTSWTDKRYREKFEEALNRPENIKLKDKFKKYPKCPKKMYAFIHMSPGAPGEGALLDLIRESVSW